MIHTVGNIRRSIYMSLNIFVLIFQCFKFNCIHQVNISHHQLASHKILKVRNKIKMSEAIYDKSF